MRDAIQDGLNERELFELHFPAMVRYGRGLMRYRALVQPPRDHPTEVLIFAGPPGSGKTFAAHALAPPGDDVYWLGQTDKWWDGYDGQHTVVIDEMAGSRIPFLTLLRLLDPYPVRLETKGGTVEFVSHRIIITTNWLPEHWYPSVVARTGWDQCPLKRRVWDKVVFFARETDVFGREYYGQHDSLAAAGGLWYDPELGELGSNQAVPVGPSTYTEYRTHPSLIAASRSALLEPAEPSVEEMQVEEEEERPAPPSFELWGEPPGLEDLSDSD